MYCSKPKKEAFVSINKLIVLGAAFILASLIGSTPAAAANPACDPVAFPLGDCDNDGILNPLDTCDNLDALLDCDGDGLLNSVDTCDNLNTTLDCDGDGVLVDACPYTVLGEDLVVGACTISGLDSTILQSGPDAGCSLVELLGDGLDNCELIGKNHGKYVSCVARLTNSYKKQKLLTGAEKGLIQSCAARSDIGKKPHP
jgi:hypothetical protein